MAQDIISKPRGNRIYSSIATYEFPTSASAISDGNNVYTCPSDGFVFIYYQYANSSYSQFIPKVNGKTLLPQTITSGSGNWNGLVGVLSFPVEKGDTVSVEFYSTFTMMRITLQLRY